MLALPSGDVQVLDDGQLFAFHGRWIGAVGLSKATFLVARERSQKYLDSRLYHELFGYLTACNCELLPIDFRCPLVWRQHTSLALIRRLWVAQFLEDGDRLLFMAPLPLSERPILRLPLADIAADATLFWQAAASVAEAMFAAGRPPELGLLEKLMQLSYRWERGWNALLATSGADRPDEWGWLPKCDRAWVDLVQKHLEPNGYLMQAASMARLL